MTGRDTPHAEVALLKDQRRILEQEAKDGVEHGRPILVDTDVPEAQHEMLSQLGFRPG